MTRRGTASFFAEGFLHGFMEPLSKQACQPASYRIDAAYELIPGWVRVLTTRYGLAALGMLHRGGAVALLLHAESVRASAGLTVGGILPLHDPISHDDLPVLHEVFAPCFSSGIRYFDKTFDMYTAIRRFRVLLCGPETGSSLCAMLGLGGSVVEVTLETPGAPSRPAVLLVSGQVEEDYAVLSMVYADGGKRGASGRQPR